MRVSKELTAVAGQALKVGAWGVGGAVPKMVGHVLGGTMLMH